MSLVEFVLHNDKFNRVAYVNPNIVLGVFYNDDQDAVVIKTSDTGFFLVNGTLETVVRRLKEAR